MLNRFITLFNGEHPHQLMYESGIERLKNRPFILNFMGEGSYSYTSSIYNIGHNATVSQFGRTVEVAWIDILGMYGIFIMSFIYLYYSFFCCISFYFFLIKRRFIFGACFICMSFYLIHSIFVGHTFYYPMQDGLVATVIAFLILTCFQFESSVKQSHAL